MTHILPRRRFLQFLGAGSLAAATMGGAVRLGRPREQRSAAAIFGPPPLAPASAHVRTLVVLELQGGNDGLSMLIPYGDPAYRKLRSRTAVATSDTVPLDGSVGLHASLRRLHGRGLAVVQGVGVPEADLSHFEMRHRWWEGSVDGRNIPDGTGFLGRLCDHLHDSDAFATGISLGASTSPALYAARAVTASLADAGGFPLPNGSEADIESWRSAWGVMAGVDPADPMMLATARAGARHGGAIAAMVSELPPPGPGYPDDGLGSQLSLAARTIASGSGVRVLHVPVDGDFDTHTDHLRRHASLMNSLDGAVDAFLADVEARGLGGQALVMTVSEFGRRPADNGSSGLDHGAASVALLAGPVRPGLFGELPSLRRLDRDDNLVASVPLTSYYATVAEDWFGIPSTEVLPGHATPLTGVLAPPVAPGRMGPSPLADPQSPALRRRG